jgi:hypothetical protein
LENLSRAEPILECFYVVVKAPNLCGEQLISIPDVYKVFWHLDMLRMSIWVHSYAVIHVRMTVNFIRKNRARLGLCDDAMKWFLRLQLCNPSLNVSHIRIGCIESVLAR